jgi:hypothetical protein
MKQILLVALLATSINAVAQDWNSSPNNWNNSPSNWQNSPNNWQNNPNNWQNNPSRFGNERLIRDTDGNVNGYAVPKSDGGVNFYDNQGNRRGYLPSTR